MKSVMKSLPMRGAWIEISVELVKDADNIQVAPHAGSVD